MAVETRHQTITEYQEHERTFSSFMQVTIWSTVIVVMAILFFTLALVVGTPWIGALAISIGVGVLSGAALGRSGVWYAAMVALFIMGLAGGGVFELIRMFMG